MAKFCKKPVVIEAVQWSGSNWHEILDFVVSQGGAIHTVQEDHEFVVKVKTLEGEMTGRPTDWIIRGIAGEFYPCRDEIFQETYEEVEE